jgi:hypothetical protein
VSRQYRGDIETIVAKALEKDKGRQYASAAALTSDIQRYLNDEPIAARPASAAYQVRKFPRRHRALVGEVAAVFVVLVAGIVASLWEAAGLPGLSPESALPPRTSRLVSNASGCTWGKRLQQLPPWTDVHRVSVGQRGCQAPHLRQGTKSSTGNSPH